MAVLETELGEIEVPDKEAKFVDFKGYRGDSLLKKAGVQIEWDEHSILEYKKCSEDPIYFIENYMKVVHVDHGLIPFKLRDYQLTLVNNVHDYRRNIITMARQSGKSTAVIGYLLWFVLFNGYKTAMVLANKAQTAREILGKAQLAYLHLPKFLQQGVVEWNKGSIVLENGSRAIAEATASDAIRGYTANLLILDEAAHVEHWDEFSSSTIPTITSGKTTKLILISTPFGLNHFYKTWMGAQLMHVPADKIPENMKWNGYVPLMVTWREVPGRDQQWFDETLAEMNFDTDKFAQEYECQFLGSSGTLIAGWKLKELAAEIPAFSKEGLKKYKEPEKSHTYIMTVDVSEGKGLDYSAFQVTDITQMPYQQVCSFKSNLISPHEFAQVIYTTAKAYNEAMVLVEYENLGPEVADTLFNDLQYENILSTESAGARGKRISTSGGGKMVDRGIKMTITVKATGCSLLKLLVEQNQYVIRDFDTIEELSRFSRKGKSYEAEEGWHDDLTMCLVVFAWLSNQEYFKEMTDINTLANLRERNEQQVEEDLVPFGFISEVEHGPPKDIFMNPDEALIRAFRDAEDVPNF